MNLSYLLLILIIPVIAEYNTFTITLDRNNHYSYSLELIGPSNVSVVSTKIINVSIGNITCHNTVSCHAYFSNDCDIILDILSLENSNNIKIETYTEIGYSWWKRNYTSFLGIIMMFTLLITICFGSYCILKLCAIPNKSYNPEVEPLLVASV